MKKPSLYVNSKGFTLLELMVTVGIIGILAAVAIPQYNLFKGRVKQAEVRAALSKIYTAEKAFHVEYGAFHSDLLVIGTVMSGGELHYNVGFEGQGPINTASLIPVGPGIYTTEDFIFSTYNAATVDPSLWETLTASLMPFLLPATSNAGALMELFGQQVAHAYDYPMCAATDIHCIYRLHGTPNGYVKRRSNGSYFKWDPSAMGPTRFFDNNLGQHASLQGRDLIVDNTPGAQRFLAGGRGSPSADLGRIDFLDD